MPSSNAMENGEQKAGKTWRYAGVTGLVLHVPSNTYYHRFSVKGKRTYRTLGTKRFRTAKLKLSEKTKEVETARQITDEVVDDVRTLSDLERIALRRLESATKHEGTKDNIRLWLKRVRKVWPDFMGSRVDRVDGEKLIALRSKLQRFKFKKGGRGKGGKPTTGYAPAVVNQTLSAVKLLTDLARELNVIFKDPFSDKRSVSGAVFLPKQNKKPNLPSHFDMARIFAEVATPQPHPLAHMRAKFAPLAKDASERVRFLAFGGMRLNEANAIRWEDIAPGTIHVRGTKSASSDRRVPVIPAMAGLLDEMRARRVAEGRPLRGAVLRGKSSLQPLGRACARLKLPKLTQHGLRHYFATICIESGVDVPTVAKWLGHSDGGAIAMRVYGHLRDEHSLTAAQKVTFGVAQPVASVGIKTS